MATYKTCAHNIATGPDIVKLPLHRCPYQADVNDDDRDDFCNCCAECTAECAADI